MPFLLLQILLRAERERQEAERRAHWNAVRGAEGLSGVIASSASLAFIAAGAGRAAVHEQGLRPRAGASPPHAAAAARRGHTAAQVRRRLLARFNEVVEQHDRDLQ